MKRQITLTVLSLSLLLSLVLWHATMGKPALAAMQATYPLNPVSFTSLGASPFTSAGTYTIDASKNNPNPILTKPDNTTIPGVFFSPSSGTTPRDEIAVFTFDTINIPANVTVKGAQNANSRPMAFLSKGTITIDGIVEVNGANGGSVSTNRGGIGGAAGPGGGGGGGGGGAGPSGQGGAGGVGFVNGGNATNGTSVSTGDGGIGGGVSTNGGGGGDQDGGGGGAFGGKGGRGGIFSRNSFGGTAYGDLALALQGGSGGGGSGAGTIHGGGGGGGGGAVEIGAMSEITILGEIRANGGDGAYNNIFSGGGGAGGGIFLHSETSVTFSNANGLSAKGGSSLNLGTIQSGGGGGGGGRVLIKAPTIIEGCVNVVAGQSDYAAGNGVYTTDGSVTKLPAVSLSFQPQPRNTTPNTLLSPVVQVSLLDRCGKVITTANNEVTLTLNNANGATLSGNSVAAANGIATFSNLKVSKTGTDYTLTASSGNLTTATSNSFNITCQTITVTPATGALTAGTVGTAYFQQFAQTGGNGTVTWGISPAIAGLTIDSTGKLSGTPTQANNYSFTVTATDGNGCPGSTSYTLAITCPTVTLPTTTLPDGSYNSAYPVTTLMPTGGTAPYSFTVSGLPAGMTRTPSAGNSGVNLMLGGTPTQPGDFTVQVTLTDAYGCASGQRSYALKINKAPLTVTVNNAFRNQGQANPPLSGSVTGQKNGDVITASYSTTAMFGSAPGNYPITATLNDPGHRLGNYQVTNTPGTLKVFNSCGITLLPFLSTQGTLGQFYAQPLNASPVGLYTFSLFAGSLPPGLTLVNNFGQYLLQGTPTSTGTFTFTLLVKRTGSTCESVTTYTMTIAPTIVPKVTCKTVNANGSYTVWFGYENSTGAVVTISVGANNTFTSGAANRGQTTVFQPGVVNNAFSVTFANAGAFTSWNLKGPDGVLRGVVPSVLSPNCP